MAETYQYRGRDTGGKLVSGTLVADSRDLVVGRMREMGYTPLEISVRRQGVKRELHFSNKVKIADLAVFSRQFATMVTSGLPILKSLAILEQQVDSRPLRLALADVRLEVEGGNSLSGAMVKHPKVFSNLYVAMV